MPSHETLAILIPIVGGIIVFLGNRIESAFKISKLRKRALEGDVSAQRSMAFGSGGLEQSVHFGGKTIESSEKLHWKRYLAERGDLKAIYSLGVHLVDEHQMTGFKKNALDALYWGLLFEKLRKVKMSSIHMNIVDPIALIQAEPHLVFRISGDITKKAKIALNDVEIKGVSDAVDRDVAQIKGDYWSAIDAELRFNPPPLDSSG